MIHFRQQEEDQQALEATASFLNYVMKKDHFSSSYLQWQYLSNPEGKAIAICAFVDDKVTGHYAAQPIVSKINGEDVRGLFILNAAVDPANQGKGLLRGIADRLHEEAARQGYRFMIGVGNKNSTPIYTKKFGFRLIGPLDVKIGAGIPHKDSTSGYFYEKSWSTDALNWRMMNPYSGYEIHQSKDQTVIYKKNFPFLASIMAEFNEKISLAAIKKSSPLNFHLYIGSDPAIQWKRNLRFITFPEIAKPSPLNLIFREVQGELIPVTKENMLFRCIDFDAF